ncbi:MAG TPA: hypothetical protein VNO21_15795 [Polyangiaceae bacterium]|nr:hypothetical protein [Polyangiaceae bacterium]
MKSFVTRTAFIAAILTFSGCGGNKGTASIDAGKSSLPDAAITVADAGTDAGDAGPPDAASADEEAPTADPTDLNLRGRHLLEAIAKGEPKLAADIVYPREAYLATRDHADPGKLWDKKFYPAFEKDIRTLRKRMKLTEQAQFVSFEIGPSVVQAPAKKHDLKRPIWRVRHSKLTFNLNGKTQRIEIADLTGWRGSWYVSKLR